MKKTLIILALLLSGAMPARAGIYYDLQQTASSATLRMVGAIKMYASAFSGSPTITLDSVGGSVSASSGTFTATGNTQFSVYTSSGITVGTNAAGGGGVYAAFFKAAVKFFGDVVGNVTGNLTGNVTGNVTGNLTGVASQATIWDHTPTKCSAGNYPLGTDTGGNAANCTAVTGDVASAGNNNFSGANWIGLSGSLNFWVQGSSGSAVAYSTGTSTNGGMVGTQNTIDSFHIVESTVVINNKLCHINDTLYTVPRSTYQIVWVDSSCGLHSGGLANFDMSTISSYTVSSTGILDGVVLILSSTNANGAVYLFEAANRYPYPTVGRSMIGNSIIGTAPNSGTGAPTRMYDCASSGVISCISHALEEVPVGNGQFFLVPYEYEGNGSGTIQYAFKVRNTGTSASNITVYNKGAGTTWGFSIDGLTQTSNTTQEQTFSIGTGYHTIMATRAASTSNEALYWQLPPNIKVVGPGYW